MVDYIVRYREKIERLSKPSVWWSIWVFGTLYLLYSIFFNAVMLLKNNYGLPGDIAIHDLSTGKIFLFATNMPLVSFTCLFASHMTLALYKMNEIKKK